MKTDRAIHLLLPLVPSRQVLTTSDIEVLDHESVWVSESSGVLGQENTDLQNQACT